MTNNTEKETKAVATTMIEKELVDNVITRINSLQQKEGLQLPKNYSPTNALNAALLILRETKDKNDKYVLQGACSKESIYFSLLDMITQGLNPVKKQCYFVPFGGKLNLMKSYMGDIAVTKRINGVKDVKYYALYENDEFETEYNVDTAILKVTKYVPNFKNIDITKLTGAFMVVVGENGPLHTEIMTMAQIRNAWNQGYAKGKSGAHINFTEEMAKKTVVHRGCKEFINSSDDSDLLIGAYNRSKTEVDDNNTIDDVEYEVEDEVKDQANSKPIDIQSEANEETKQPVKENKAEAKTAKTKQGQPEQISMNKPGF